MDTKNKNETGIEIEIEKGVEVPKTTRGGGYRKYPFDKLEPGQSFFVADMKKGNAASLCTKYSKGEKTKRFIARSAEKDGEAGIRIFCVARETEAPAPAPARLSETQPS